ncbi:MAG: DNA/RNA non-specific endonuclease [Pyrinomonadaceae bacterium]|nr:DNA/RNA non-specific endonuclease [Pyrinomonadaceae bacterium]MDW8304736.1 DNA/RNA non-specific endonuclease [Acidobacteriota bacterium]
MKKKLGILVAVLAFVFALFIGLSILWIGSKFLTPTERRESVAPERTRSLDELTETESLQVHLPFGNPSNASKTDPENFLLVNQYMVISYSRSRRIPNWVAWRLTADDIGKLDRIDSFRPDDRIPAHWGRVIPSDYTGTGFDRGHICPSADREGSQKAMDSTFLMTNIAPQTPDLNRGPWEKFESYLRTLARRRKTIYTIAGSYGESGKIKNKIAVPETFWKIATIMPDGAPPSSINENTRVIAVEMPNVRGIKNADWFIYRTTVREIEKKTGYNFFSSLPQNLQEALETKKDGIID